MTGNDIGAVAKHAEFPAFDSFSRRRDTYNVHPLRTPSLDAPTLETPAFAMAGPSSVRMSPDLKPRSPHAYLSGQRSASPPILQQPLLPRSASPPILQQPLLQQSASPPACPFFQRSASPLQVSLLPRSASPPANLAGPIETAMISQSNSSSAPIPDATSIFGALPKLDLRIKSSCDCCMVAGDAVIASFPEVPLTIPGNRKLMLPVDTDEEFSRELWTALGPTVWETLLDDVSPSEICPISGVAGLNHVFIAKVGSWFVKVVEFKAAATSESQQMEYLKQEFPTLIDDPTLVFPTKWCRIVTPNHEVSYDMLVYTYVDGKNVRDLIRLYDQSAKDRKICLRGSMTTLIRCCAELLRRYHLVHGRKHGDAKADNFIVTVDGRILLCDHGVNSLALCDKSEFVRSLMCLDPEVAKFKTMFGTFFDETRAIRDVSEDDRTQIREVMHYLTDLRASADANGAFLR